MTDLQILLVILFVLSCAYLHHYQRRSYANQHEEKIEVNTEYSLKELFHGVNPTVDIIAVHGIAAAPDWTWITNNVHWLRNHDMLPDAVPNTRIMQFGYESQWLKRRFVKQRLSLIARELLLRLEEKRQSCPERPVIFIGHCFGGLVIEKLLLLSCNLQSHTAGIVFLGTPHRGSRSQSKASILASIAAVSGFGDRSSLLNAVQMGSDLTEDLVPDFTSVVKDVDICCFFEKYPTDIAAVVRPAFLRFLSYWEVMVPEDSACLDISETRCGLARDHFHLNKFTGPDDPEFRLVREQIKRLVGNAHTRKAASSSPVEDAQIAKLPVANGAAFDSKLWQHKHQCLEGTRVGLLEQILDWGNNSNNQQKEEPIVYWLKGMAGTGKSTVARTVCHRLNRQKCLGASFFFSRGEDDLCNATRFFSTIAAQLVNTVPELKRHVSNAIAADNSRILEQGFSEQWKHLIFEPLSRLQKPSLSRIVLVIDALDECEGRAESREDVRLILDLLTQVKSLTTVQLRIFITSRPEVAVTGSSREIYQVEFHRLPSSMVNDADDITMFFEHELGKIRTNYEQRKADGESPLPTNWPSKNIVKALVDRAGGLFIYASTVCLFISYEDMHPVESLSIILEVGAEKQLPLPNLDNMYKKVLELSVSTKYNAYVKERLRTRFRLVVGSLAVLFDSVSTATLANLLAVSPEEINGTFSRLRSVLDIPNNQDSVIRLLHTSFRDFLLDQERCSDSQFWIDKGQAHTILTEQCLQLMQSHLQRDMAKLRVAGALASTVDENRLRGCLPLHIQYSCRYWVSHLQLSNIELRDDGSIYIFLKKHFLHWIEALSLMQNVSEGVYMIRTLEKLLVSKSTPKFLAMMRDAKRFILFNRYIIQNSPLQTYTSALLFIPNSSVIKRIFPRPPSWIELGPIIGQSWSLSVQTLEGHSGRVTHVEYSRNGRWLASTSTDHTLRIWDADTGALQRTFQEGTDEIASVTFSNNSRWLAYSFEDTVKVINAETGSLQWTLEGHQGWVQSISFAADNRSLASASVYYGDRTIRIWDVETGVLYRKLDPPGYRSVQSLAFSNQTEGLLASCLDEQIHIWDTRTGDLQQTLENPPGQGDSYDAAVFSPDDRQLVCSCSRKVLIWCTTTWTVQHIFDGDAALSPTQCFTKALTWSGDGHWVASGSTEGSVQIWDTKTGILRQTLKGHTGWLESVTFSPDSQRLASSAFPDNIIRIWDIESSTTQAPLQDHDDGINGIALSSDCLWLAAACGNKTARIWSTQTGNIRWTLGGHLAPVFAVVFSPDCRRLASASPDRFPDGAVRLWDIETGALLQIFQSYPNGAEAAFSPDSALLACFGRSTPEVHIWEAGTGVLLQKIKDNACATSVMFPDDDNNKRRVVGVSSGHLKLGGHTSEIRKWLWDAEIASPQQTFENDSESNSRLVDPVFEDTTTRVLDVKSSLQQSLAHRSIQVHSVQFSHDAKLVATASSDNVVRIWSSGGALQQEITVESAVKIISFSPDSSRLNTDIGSFDLSSLEWSPCRLKGDRSWVTWKGNDLLWLPPEYRSELAMICGRIIVLPILNRVAIIRVKEVDDPIYGQ